VKIPNAQAVRVRVDARSTTDPSDRLLFADPSEVTAASGASDASLVEAVTAAADAAAPAGSSSKSTSTEATSDEKTLGQSQLVQSVHRNHRLVHRLARSMT